MKKIFLCFLCLLAGLYAKEGEKRMGYVKGAEVIEVEVKDPFVIDCVSGVYYSQIKTTRSFKGYENGTAYPSHQRAKISYCVCAWRWV